MTQVQQKDDPLTRIQREIIEVTEREREFKEGHFRINRLMSESTLDMNGHGQQNGDRRPKVLNRAVSTSQLMGPVSPTTPSHTNGYARRFTPQSGTKGIMQRFIASKGKLSLTPPVNGTPITPYASNSPILPSPVATVLPPEPTATFQPELKPVRKGFVPVEEKIQKELREMKDREHELKRMRRQRRPFELELSDEESGTESEEEDIPAPGGLRVTKSIGELYAALSDELRTPSPRQGSGSGAESLGSLKPAKSLAELCDLAPGQEFLAPSSTRLIAQWESIIQQKQEAGAA